MIKFIVAAIWICGVTVGSMMYAFSGAQTASSPAEAEAATYFGGIDYVKTDTISVPIVREASVQGYFIARFVYTAEQKRLAALTVPAESMLVDEAFTYLYSNPMIDFTNVATIDIDGFRNGLRDAMNKRLGEDLIKDVMIEQVDYLSKQEIRDNAIRRKAGQKVPSLDRGHQKLDIPEENKDGGHGEKPAAH